MTKQDKFTRQTSTHWDGTAWVFIFQNVLVDLGFNGIDFVVMVLHVSSFLLVRLSVLTKLMTVKLSVVR